MIWFTVESVLNWTRFAISTFCSRQDFVLLRTWKEKPYTETFHSFVLFRAFFKNNVLAFLFSSLTCSLSYMEFFIFLCFVGCLQIGATTDLSTQVCGFFLENSHVTDDISKPDFQQQCVDALAALYGVLRHSTTFRNMLTCSKCQCWPLDNRLMFTSR